MLANLNSAQQLHQALTSGESGLLTLETGDFLTDISHDSLKAFLKGLEPGLQLSGLPFFISILPENPSSAANYALFMQTTAAIYDRALALRNAVILHCLGSEDFPT